MEKASTSSGDFVHEESILNNSIKNDITNAFLYCKSLLEESELLVKNPPSEMSHSSIVMGEEFYNSIVTMLDERKIIEDEELITKDEDDETNEYTECIGVPEDDDNFVAQEFAPEPRDYIPLSYKERAVAIADAHPKWSLKCLQNHGASRLKHKQNLYRWKEDVKRGGTYFDRWKTIDSDTYERFLEARSSMEQVTTRTLQQWAMNAAFQFLSDEFHFIASKSWVERFKKKHGIRQRKITKFISHKEVVSIGEVMESAEKFRLQTKALMSGFDRDYIINTDQSGCQYQSTYNRSLAEKGAKTIFVKKKNISLTTHSYTAQYALTASGKVLPFVFVCLREPSGAFGPQIKKQINQLSKIYNNIIITCTKSGKLTKQQYEKFLKTCLLPYVQENKFLLIIDSWVGQTDTTVYDDIFLNENGEATCTVKISPLKCTPICQPCDVYFFRQIKIFIKKIQNAPELLADKRELTSREDIMKIHSLILHQLNSPKFTAMIQYAWFASKLIDEREIFMNVNQLCFSIKNLKTKCNCNNNSFIKCAVCDKTLCFKCFYDDYHPNECLFTNDSDDDMESE
ncbi:uncharacterized protein [Neodiprion pinetum]|uniref:uncharacterized protein n=1 Tax=Neodiprion pinetum TaxID=441929 RepID=UPI001EDD3F81|nr:uncharacterized protein LOC124216100 [Neodiprion pinetum]